MWEPKTAAEDPEVGDEEDGGEADALVAGALGRDGDPEGAGADLEGLGVRDRVLREETEQPVHEPEGLLLGTLHARTIADEDHLRARELAQHIVRADGVERRHAVVEQDRDPHGVAPFGREYATPAIWLLGH